MESMETLLGRNVGESIAHLLDALLRRNMGEDVAH